MPLKIQNRTKNVKNNFKFELGNLNLCEKDSDIVNISKNLHL